MTRTVVGVLRGGPSPEYDVSLKTGAALMNALPDDKYRVLDIFIDKQGNWHHLGRPNEPFRILSHVDVVLNGLHGSYGEDGTVQRLLDRAGVAYTGSRPDAAALSMHKAQTRNVLAGIGVLLPRGVTFNAMNMVTPRDMAKAIFAQFGPPYVVKPVAAGSSVGVVLVQTIADLPAALAALLEEYGTVLVEEFIRGKEATVGIIDRFRNQDTYALPPVEIIPKGRSFFDYAAKYEGASEERCPGTFNHSEKSDLEEIARIVHRHIGLSHYSRSDFIVHPRGKIYFLEVNALPGLTEQSLLPRALTAVGSSLPDFAEHLIRLAQNRT